MVLQNLFMKISLTLLNLDKFQLLRILNKEERDLLMILDGKKMILLKFGVSVLKMLALT
jgi:hypothetical protein